MRQLKQFLRKRKAEMLACGDCECRTLKCRREATCECTNDNIEPGPTPTPGLIEGTFNWSTDTIAVDYNDEETRTAINEFEYSPAEGNSGIELQYDGGGYFTAEITSLSNGQGVITITALQEEGMAEPATVSVYLESTQSIDYSFTVEVSGV